MSTENVMGATAAEETKATKPVVAFTSEIVMPEEVRAAISAKAEEIKAQHKLRKIFIMVIEGEECDEKPFYVAYLRRPGAMVFSQYMNFAQKDIVQASRNLLNNVFIAGDRELVDDDDLFIYGAMPQVNMLLESRNADMVKK